MSHRNRQNTPPVSQDTFNRTVLDRMQGLQDAIEAIHRQIGGRQNSAASSMIGD